ncbi:MAG TPA: M20/M25/M40 family metallo-hydrolase, partial [Planctomycetaceae bacterium]|nr:M20/M25/M40 family metallo-hydrolase [Planctomycetaceae bacterium]
GRGVGTRGLDLAAEFIREEFEKAGLDVTAVDGGPFQGFTMTIDVRLGRENALSFAGPDGQTIDLVYDQDARTCSFGGSGRFDAGVVFAGYAIDDEKYSDLKGLDLEGNVALIIRRVPRQGDKDGPFSTPHGPSARHAALTTKVSNVFRKGAVAAILVDDPHTARADAERLAQQTAKAQDDVFAATAALESAGREANERGELETKLFEAVRHLRSLVEQARQARQGRQGEHDSLFEFGYGGRSSGRSIPVFQITRASADRLLGAAMGRSLEDLEAEIDSDLLPRSAVLAGWQARGVASVEPVEAHVKNVIGVLEGEGPLAEETIVLGAHYDHIGLGGIGSGSMAPGEQAIHNGADDNASGTSGLLELARRFAAQTEKPPRRLVFIAFTAEERGLLGSAHYVREPVFPLDKTVAMLNLDMIGRLRDEKLTVFGTGTSPGWSGLVGALAKKHGLEAVQKPEGFGPSDHSSFYGKQIPVLHFFTNTHSDYHRPSDDWDKVNVAGMRRIVDFIEDIALDTLARPERPAYVEVKGRATIDRSGARPYFGSIPDFGSEEAGYTLQGVSPGSPAAEAGLKGGDRIVNLGGQKIGSLEDFDLALRKFNAGDQVDVGVVREGEERTFKVTLGRPR